MGLFFTLPLLYIKPGKYLTRNMAFSGISKTGVFQYFYCSLQIIVFILYFSYQESIRNIYLLGEIMTITLAVLVRIVLVSIKYSLYSPNYMYYIKHNYISDNEVEQNIFLLGWNNQVIPIFILETNFMINKLDLDKKLFFIQFFNFLPESQIKALDKIQTILQEQGQTLLKSDVLRKSSIQKFSNSNDYYYGVYFFKLMIDIHCKEFGWVKKILQVLILISAYVKIFLPSISRLNDYDNFYGEIAVESSIIFLTQLINLMTSIANSMPIAVGIFDIHRIHFVMNQLGKMMAVHKYELLEDEKKLFPTINIMSPFILDSWLNLRRIGIDYGKKYLMRNYLVSTFNILYLLLLNLVLFLIVGGALKIQDNALISIIFADNVLISFLMIIMLLQGAFVNEGFDQHLDILNENLSIFKQLYYHQSLYFCEYPQQQNFVYRRIIAEFKQQCSLKLEEIPTQHQMQSISIKLKEIIYSYKEIIRQIKIDSVQNPFNILGIKVTMAIVQLFCTSLLSMYTGLLIIAFQSYLSQPDINNESTA